MSAKQSEYINESTELECPHCSKLLIRVRRRQTGSVLYLYCSHCGARAHAEPAAAEPITQGAEND